VRHAARLSAAAGELAQAERELGAVLAADPCDEEAALLLMQVLRDAGRRAEALRVYATLSEALREELGVAPRAAVSAVYDELLRADEATALPPRASAGMAAVIPRSGAAASAAPRTGNLPAPLSSFIGRDEAVRALRERLTETRLLTLTGVGGCGKTRLALRVAAEVQEAYCDGAWLVDLAPVRAETDVARAVAEVLGVHEEAGRPLLATLTAALRPRHLLLVLDNCEHLVTACAELAAALLTGCPELRILATSREALGLVGEVAWPVPPLSLPDELPANGRPSVAVVSRSEAVQLFVARAQERQPGFALTAENAGAVVRVVRRLDGLPLALELAAARLGALTVAQVAQRLDDRFRLLTGGSRAALPRQQTLRATLDWSHDLLCEEERAVLRRAAVFAGGWTLEAAEAVCAADAVAPEAVLDLLAGLVAKSLVQATTRSGAARYGLLETVRAYAWEHLKASREAEATARTHAAYYLALAEAAETSPTRSEQMAGLEREVDNLRAALAWALARRDQPAGAPDRVEVGRRLEAALARYRHMHGHLSDTCAPRTTARSPAFARRWATPSRRRGRQERLCRWSRPSLRRWRRFAYPRTATGFAIPTDQAPPV
jgi:predicted ATPase